MLLDGLIRVRRNAFSHGAFSPVTVAPAQLSEAADLGDCIAFDLVAEVAADVTAAGIDRRGGTDAGGRRHRRDVARVGDVRARGRCPSSRGPDVHHHGHL